MSTSLAISTAALSVALANQSGGVMIPVDNSAKDVLDVMMMWFLRLGLPALPIGMLCTYLWYYFNPSKLKGHYDTPLDRASWFLVYWLCSFAAYLIITVCIAAWI